MFIYILLSVTLINFFLKDTASLLDSIKKPVRSEPFIIKIGQSYTVIVHKNAFIQASTGSTEAIVHLIAVHFLFNIFWSKSIKNVYFFLQSKLLGINSESSNNNKSYKFFVQSFEEKELALKDKAV